MLQKENGKTSDIISDSVNRIYIPQGEYVIPDKLTRRERYYLNFEEGNTPHSLQIPPAFYKTLPPTGFILDNGSGSGRTTVTLAGRDDEKGILRYAFGMDINKREVIAAKKFVNENFVLKDRDDNPLVDFFQRDCTDLSGIQDNLFSGVSFVGTIGIVEPQVRAAMLKEGVRVLRPGKSLLIVEFLLNESSDEQKGQYRDDEEEYYSMSGIKEYGTRIVRDPKDPEQEIHWISTHFKESTLIKMLVEMGLVSIRFSRGFVTTAAFKGVEIKKRPQIAVWGVKPSNK